MNFLYQIITSAYAYTLYEEDGHIFLHVLNLRTEESTDVFGVSKLMDILSEDTEVSFEDLIEIDDIISILLSN